MIGFVAKGSKEQVHVDLVDRTGLVTDFQAQAQRSM